MNGYTPIPFARPPIDQTAERLKLADLLYQANMARVQAEQERQMTYARMIAQTGQMIGSGIEDYLTRQQRERALAIQAERENRLASAQEAQNAMMMQRMAAEDARNTLALQENLYDKMAGGATMYGGEDEMRQRLGPYADLMQFSPELTATQQRITPAETLQVGPSAMPAQPGVLESRPMNLAVLAGTAEPTTTTYEASMTKPYSAAEQKAMDEAAQQERQRSVQMEIARIMGNPSIPDEEKQKAARQFMLSGMLPAAVYSAAFPKPSEEPVGNKRFLELRVDELMKSGMSEVEANKVALRELDQITPKAAPVPVVYVNPVTGEPGIINRTTGEARPVTGVEGVAAPSTRSKLSTDLIERVVAPAQPNLRPGLRNAYNQMDDNQVVQSVINDSKLVDNKQRELIEKRKTSLTKLRELRSMVSSLGTDFATATIGDIAEKFGRGDQKRQQLRAALAKLAEETKIELTGLASTQGEQERYNKIVPLEKMNTDLNLQRIDQLINDVTTQQRSALSMIDPRLANSPTTRMYFGGPMGLSERARNR